MYEVTRIPSRNFAIDTAQFIQRSKALGFYRAILRGTARIGDPSTREESRRYARAEFERHREVTDIVSPL
jgi:complex 1 LYR family protein